jgi:hypothetical protein
MLQNLRRTFYVLILLVLLVLPSQAAATPGAVANGTISVNQSHKERNSINARKQSQDIWIQENALAPLAQGTPTPIPDRIREQEKSALQQPKDIPHNLSRGGTTKARSNPLASAQENVASGAAAAGNITWDTPQNEGQRKPNPQIREHTPALIQQKQSTPGMWKNVIPLNNDLE